MNLKDRDDKIQDINVAIKNISEMYKLLVLTTRLKVCITVNVVHIYVMNYRWPIYYVQFSFLSFYKDIFVLRDI